MKNTKTVIKRGGISFGSLLALVFITLKLCGVINWSWLWVLSPLWIGIALAATVGITILLGGLIIAGTVVLVESIKKH